MATVAGRRFGRERERESWDWGRGRVLDGREEKEKEGEKRGDADGFEGGGMNELEERWRDGGVDWRGSG